MRMAKGATVTQLHPKGHGKGGGVVVVRTAAAPKKGTKHRRGASRQSAEKALGAMALGGFILGKIDSSSMNIPTLPVVGRAGTIAIAAHMFAKGKPGMITDVRNAAAAVAGYEYGSKGSISGDGAV